MTLRRLGDRDVFPIAIGTAAWSLIDLSEAGRQVTPEHEGKAISAVHAALDCGVTVFDTARAYTTPSHPGHAEQLLAHALKGHPSGDHAVIATKAGHSRAGRRFPEDFPIDTSASAIRRHVRTSLELLELETIWLLQLHWPPANGSMTEAMRVFADLLAEGLIHNVGICNVSRTQTIEARSVVPVASVQNHFSPFNQQDLGTLEYCSENDIAYLAYSPLGGDRSGKGPALASAFPDAERAAADRGVTIQCLALAWLLAQSPNLIPVSGASSVTTVRSSAAAATAQLSVDEARLVGF